MQIFKFIAIAMSMAAAPALAQADGAPAAETAAASVKKGAMIFSAEGRRIGRVDYVRDGAAGVIFDGRFVNIPLSTLNSDQAGFRSSLTRSEISKL